MDDITFVNRSPEFLGNGAAGHLMGGPDNLLIPLDIDGDAHTRFRRLLDPLFAPKSKISRLEPVVRALTDELIDGFVADGEVEAYSRFCAPLPTRIFVDMLGLPPEDLEFFQAFKDGVIRPEGTPQRRSTPTRPPQPGG
jgi:cytochrome P450